MSGAHAHVLHFHGHSPVHRMASHAKVVGLFSFVAAVVTTPTHAVWAFGIHAAVLFVAVGLSELPARFFLRRLSIETPFVVLALAMPLVGPAPTVEIGPLALSVTGLWGAWNVIAKATLCVGASVVLTATTEVPDLLAGFERLRAPRLLTAIAAFMVRYMEVIIAEVGRVRTAIAARLGDSSRRQEAATLAAVSGTMFLRSYERGERVHQAMLARGYTGSMPLMIASAAPSRWVMVATWSAAAWLVTTFALVTT